MAETGPMTDSAPSTDGPVFDAITKASRWLSTRLGGPFKVTSVRSEPAAMTDVQLRQAVYRVNHDLVDDTIGPWLMRSFDGGPLNDPRLPRAIPTSPLMHVLLGFAAAHDAANLAAIGLQLHASAAALAPIRAVAETIVQLSWMLDTDDDLARLGRAYGLTQAGLDDERRMIDAHERSARRMNRTVADWVPKLATAEKRTRAIVADMAQEDGVVIAKLPSSAELFEQYLADEGGYTFFSMLSTAGIHTNPSRPSMFYRVGPIATTIDFDFQGMHAVRAYWMSIAVRLHINLARLVAPELGWPNWDSALGKLREQLVPLATEAEKRYMAPLKAFLDRLPSSST